MTLLPAHRLGFALAALVFAADQMLKWLVTGPLALNQIGQSITLLPVFNFTYAENNGVSLNLFAADSATGRWLLVALTATIALVVTVWMLREKHRAEIESELGLGELSWQPLPNKKACRVRLFRPFDDAADNWDDGYAWLMTTGQKFKRVFARDWE